MTWSAARRLAQNDRTLELNQRFKEIRTGRKDTLTAGRVEKHGLLLYLDNSSEQPSRLQVGAPLGTSRSNRREGTRPIWQQFMPDCDDMIFRLDPARQLLVLRLEVSCQ